jgi:dTDP-4-amino-4,6-dideoxygalactose transaminase
MTTRNIPLFKVFMADDAIKPLEQVLRSGYIGQGSKVDEFESQLISYLNSPYVNVLNSATSGLHLALDLIKRFTKSSAVANEVITTPLTCTATNFPILANGLKIKWADIDPATCNIDLNDVRKKINEKTLAIMVVHWGGLPVNLDELKKIQADAFDMYGHMIPIIEDCAHAFGSQYRGRMIGSSGNFCVFSFQAIKHLTTGDGGLLICPNDATHRQAKLLRWFGLDRTSSADFRCEQNIAEWGYKFHMNDIAASIGLSNMKFIKEIVAKHHENYEWLVNEHLVNQSGITCMKSNPEDYSSNWICTLLVDRRDDFMRKMKEYGIGVSRVHDRNDKHSCLQEFRSMLPNTDYVCERMCCIPCGWWVTNEDREYIVDCIKKGW